MEDTIRARSVPPHKAWCAGDTMTTASRVTGALPTCYRPPGTNIITGIVQVVAGFEFTCALYSTGQLGCWGRNIEGEIGDVSAGTSVLTPPNAPNSALGGVLQAGVSATSVFVIMRGSGGLRGWGDNT